MPPPPPEPTDAELAHRVTHGPDPTAAFDDLYGRHAARLLAFLRDRFPALADDLCKRRGRGRSTASGKDRPPK